MGASEIGERLRISRQRTYQLVNRRDFPPPLAVLAMGQVWDAEDVGGVDQGPPPAPRRGRRLMSQ